MCVFDVVFSFRSVLPKTSLYRAVLGSPQPCMCSVIPNAIDMLCAFLLFICSFIRWASVEHILCSCDRSQGRAEQNQKRSLPPWIWQSSERDSQSNATWTHVKLWPATGRRARPREAHGEGSMWPGGAGGLCEPKRFREGKWSQLGVEGGRPPEVEGTHLLDFKFLFLMM